ncbi:uncharacterized protein LOC117106899 isoform X2 [Anneissia japonica]|uniref:uncharacterized protein LOC117106899 isoform X2 n=1 Tax=Anneissia japonica TaxID=1529436 RepID=UPI0014258C4C|nr:uncharacterized protein LOC117106899 isoform X2 [Anneissia japonica]
MSRTKQTKMNAYVMPSGYLKAESENIDPNENGTQNMRKRKSKKTNRQMKMPAFCKHQKETESAKRIKRENDSAGDAIESGKLENAVDGEIDIYIISDDSEWDEKLSQDLQHAKPGVKCLTRKDTKMPGKPVLDYLVKPALRSQKVIVGYISKPLTGSPTLVAETVVQKMLENNNLSEGMLIPAKLDEDAIIPDSLKAIEVADGRASDFVDRVLKTLN